MHRRNSGKGWNVSGHTSLAPEDREATGGGGDPAELTPSAIVSKMVSLHCAAELAKEVGYSMRAGYDASQLLQEMVAYLIESGQLLEWSQAYEEQKQEQELHAKCEVRFA